MCGISQMGNWLKKIRMTKRKTEKETNVSTERQIKREERRERESSFCWRILKLVPEKSFLFFVHFSDQLKP